jgi:hypothetical protein
MRCSAITKGGRPCQGAPIRGSSFCYSHSPDLAEERRRNAHKGGKRGGRGRPLSELSSIRDENAEIRRMLLEGELLPGVASIAVQSLNLDIRAVDVSMKAKEQEELEQRLSELEVALERQKGQRWYGAYSGFQ